MVRSAADALPQRLQPASWRRWRTGDFREFAADAVVVSLPRPLAGLGTSRQLAGLCDGLSKLGRSNAIRTAYIGPSLPGADPLLDHPFVVLDTAPSTPETYRNCESAFTEGLIRLATAGCRRVIVVSMGYTAFGPQAAKLAFRNATDAGLEELLVFMVDSAFPDRDEPEVEVDAEGYPTGRFFEAAYSPAPGVHTVFLLTSAYQYDPAILSTRAPGVSRVGMIAPPYTEDYIETLRKAGAQGRAGGPLQLQDVFSELAAWRPGDLLVPFVSSDIWSPSAVGAWMTREEHQTVLDGTATVIRGLALVAHKRECRVFVPVDDAVLQVLDAGFDDLWSPSVEHGPGVALLPYKYVEQTNHARLLGAADLAVSRSGAQANASVVLALAGTPSVVMDLPAAGYMQSELSSAAIELDISVDDGGVVQTTPREQPLGWLTSWRLDAAAFADVVTRMLEDPDASARRAAAAQRAFMDLRNSQEGNFFTILDQLTR